MVSHTDATCFESYTSVNNVQIGKRPQVHVEGILNKQCSHIVYKRKMGACQ